MIDQAYVQRMARYNRWQNENLYGVADGLSEQDRRTERGAFFGSIHKTLSHLLWADRIWLARFTNAPQPPASIPESVSLFPEWLLLKDERATTDAGMIHWAETVDPAWLTGELTWFSGVLKRQVSKPAWLLVTHYFNHQTHHRGQVHAMLTQAGGKPHDTDLFLMPE
jgi:uncharacterized damage-inducible protein DinB